MKTVVFDWETEPFADSGRVRVDFPCPVPVLLGLYDGQTYRLIPWHAHSDVVAAFNDNHTQYIAFNAKFDCRILFEKYGILPSLCLDAQVLYKLRYPLRDRLTNLAAVHQHLFPSRPGLDKGGVRLSFSQSTPPTSEQIQYLKDDLKATWDVFHALHRLPLGELARPECTYHVKSTAIAAPDPDQLFSRANVLLATHLEPHGLVVNQPALQAHLERLTDEANTLNAALFETGLATIKRRPKAKPVVLPSDQFRPDWMKTWTPVAATSPPCLLRHIKGRTERIEGVFTLKIAPLRELFSSEARRLKLVPPVSLRTRRLSLGEDFWKEYSTQLSPPAQTFLKLVRVKKYLSAFIRPLVDSRAERVYPSYWVPGAETGRWATTSPCIHQVPKTLKDIYVPAPGNSFYSCDYKSLELYTLAQTMLNLGIDGALRRVLNSGEDVHRLTAASMYDLVTMAVTDDQRQAAKACNFGLPGGMGPAKFRTYLHGLGLHLDLPGVRDIISRWFRAYPDVRSFLDRFNIPTPFFFKPDGLGAREWLEQLGFDVDNAWPSSRDIVNRIRDGAVYSVTLPGGRVLHQRTYSAAANSCFQGPGADIITQAFVNVCRNNLIPVAVIHDSIVVEAPAGDQKTGETLILCMTEALAEFCPDLKTPELSFKETPHL
jgi:DNA polymerase family A/3'-5' exonuclease